MGTVVEMPFCEERTNGDCLKIFIAKLYVNVSYTARIFA
jgi:hypothetical protein